MSVGMKDDGLRAAAMDGFQLRDHLRFALQRGEFILQGFLVPETELMHAFSSSRAVVRQALALLQDEGLVQRTRGLGTRVAAIPQPVSIQDSHGHVPTDAQSLWAGRMRMLVRSRGWVTPSRRGPGSYRIDYSMLDASGAVGYGTCIAYGGAARQLSDAPTLGDWHSLVRHAGIVVRRSELTIGVSVADERDVQIAQFTPGMPIFVIEHRMHTGEGAEAALVSTIRSRGDKSAIYSDARDIGFQ